MTKQHAKNLFKHKTRLCSYATVLLFAIAVSPTGHAAPQGGQVVRGEGAIQQPDTQSTIVNQNSPSMVVNWDSFNVDTNETVQFVQPSASASVLNRIMDQNPSQIFGTIDGNGRVFLINPNGIVFGETASVNVGSLVASGLNIDPDAFMNGDYRFAADEGQQGGVVINRGVIQAATGGSVNLIGSAVKNEGLIVAQVGKINMGAGRSVVLDFDGDGLMRFEVDGEIIENTSRLAAAVSNSGELVADGGEILLSAKAARNVFDRVINNEGVIKATRIERQGGVVRLLGDGGEVQHSGSIDASGYDAGEHGGDVEILGDQVRLMGDSRIDVSGSDGGGTVRVGGGKGGQGTQKTATTTYVSDNSEITADAVDKGDGGEVYVWADDDTTFHGSISARGGQQSGNGGFVEISGRKTVTISNYVDLTASNGDTGMLFIDPGTIHVCDDASAGCSAGLFGPNTFSDDYISTQLATADITLDTSDPAVDNTNGSDQDIIFLDTTIDVSWNSGNSLILNAGRNITLNGFINDNASGGTFTINVGQQNVESTFNMGDATLTVSSVTISGGTGADAIVGPNTTTEWTISGADSGSFSGVDSFSGIENITGGSGVDTFTIAADFAGMVNGGDNADIFNINNSMSGTLTGGNGDDTFNVAANYGGSVYGGAGNDIFNINSSMSGTLNGDAGDDTFHLTDDITAGALDGGDDNDTVIAPDVTNTWVLSGIDSGSVTTSVGTGSDTEQNFTTMETLIGGNGIDTVFIADIVGDNFAGVVQGGGNADIFNINNSMSGALAGGSGDDAFNFSDGVTVGSIDGGANNDTLDLSAYTIARNIELTASSPDGFDGTDTSLTGAFRNIDAIVGSSASDTLTGISTTAAWSINVINNNSQYTTGGNTLTYSAIESITGGGGADTFNIAGDYGGSVNGGAGNDIFNITTSMSGALNGDAGADTFNLSDDVNVGTLDGGTDSDNDTLVAPDVANSWNVTGTYSGNIITSVGAGSDTAQNFMNMDSLTGGAGADTFNIVGNYSGNINAGAQADVFNINTNMAGTLNGDAGDDIFNLTDDMTAASLDGGDGNDTVIAPDVTNTWILSGTDSGSVTTSMGSGSDTAQSFTTMETLMGGNGIDSVTITDIVGDNFAGTVRGGGNADIFNIDNTMTGSLYGDDGDDTFNLGDDVSVGRIDGGADNDTLIAPDTDNAWTFFGASLGEITTSVDAGANTAQSFANMEILNGGNAVDVFTINGNFAGTANGGGAADIFDINASMSGTLNGDAGADSFNLGDAVTVGAVDGGTQSDTLNFSAYTTVREIGLTDSGANGFSGSEDSITNGFYNMDTVVGSAAADTLNVLDSSASWNLGIDSQYTEGGNTLLISSVETLNAGAAQDTFAVTGDFNGAVNAGAGDDVFDIQASMSGALNGDAGADTFNVSDGVTIGIINGGADIDTLNFSAYSTSRNILLTNSGTDGFGGNEASVSGGFSNIDTIVGGLATDSLTGINTAATWIIDSSGQYTVGTDTLAYSAIETLNGGTAIDTFNIEGDFTGMVNGGAEADTFTINASMSGTLNGDAGDDRFYLSDDVTAGGLDGGADNDTLVAPDVATTWDITGLDSGTLTTSVGSAPDVAQSFVGMEVLNGGAGADTFYVNGDYGGTINGGDNSDEFIINNAMSGALNGDGGSDTFELNANVNGTVAGGADADTFNLNADVQTINIVGGSGSDVAYINSDLIVGGDTIITLGEGEITGSGSLESSAGSFNLSAGTVTLNSVSTANNISVEALDGNINLGQLRSSDGTVSLTVHSGDIVNQNNGYIEADQLLVDLGNTGVMGSLSSPFEIQIDLRSYFGNLTSSQLQSRVFITDNSFTGALSSGILAGVGSVLAQANAGLSAVTKDLNIIDPGIFLTEINLFNVESTGMKLPADQQVE
ncbi:MAG: filamentous hemagglutinin N-terminal domain-containing protein [Gammaproteobacteria bacterium]|nr:filamentous hemagglutinin N-terminal domain-containing protein [Gammaproteobacteria bacterium]